MNTIHVTKVAEFLNTTKGKFFSVTFTKLDGSERKLNGRIGVFKGVKGTQKSPAAHSANPYRVVWDAVVEQFRMVNLSTIKEIRFNHQTYVVTQ